MLGEAGPEAVIPLGQGGMGFGTVNITVNGNIDSEVTLNKLAREIKDLLFQDDRRGLRN